jgi:hypothetical protein
MAFSSVEQRRLAVLPFVFGNKHLEQGLPLFLESQRDLDVSSYSDSCSAASLP